MRFAGPGGRAFECAPVGYEFWRMGRLGWWNSILRRRWPAFDHDANWLVIAVTASDGDRNWSFRHPCLLTTELQSLAAWFDAIADGNVDTDEIHFIEPNLAFRKVSDQRTGITIRVSFELEARPPWRREDDWGSVWLEFPVTSQTLTAAADDVRDDLKRFPERWRGLV